MNIWTAFSGTWNPSKQFKSQSQLNEKIFWLNWMSTKFHCCLLFCKHNGLVSVLIHHIRDLFFRWSQSHSFASMAQVNFNQNSETLLTIVARILLIVAIVVVFMLLVLCYVLSTKSHQIVLLASPTWFHIPHNSSNLTAIHLSATASHPWDPVLFMWKQFNYFCFTVLKLNQQIEAEANHSSIEWTQPVNVYLKAIKTQEIYETCIFNVWLIT